MAKVNLRAYNREIESMVDGGLYQEAVAHCLHILKTHPKHLETYRLLGKAYLELKQYSDATDIFQRLLSCVPNDFVANVGMGIIRDEENKIDDAIWHMERAFETQPSNPAIQGELQRLYARRDGSAPPRIRMTRGALAQMYLQGELYPQAISEIKGVLGEDPGRTDMQVLLSKAHFRAGQKNEAAEVASAVLRRYPYCLDANRVLAEIFGSDRPESATLYLQRIYELDPYAAHVSGSVFQSADAPESAIALEKLDWNGQPVGMPSDWRETRGISLHPEEGKEGPPAWLQQGYQEAETIPPTPLIPPHPGESSVTAGDEDIPDFLRDAGWRGSTGSFDESKSSFAEERSEASPAVAGDLPDWVREMAPPEATASSIEKEELPDWMNRIDPGILGGTVGSSSVATDEPDWLKGIGQPQGASESTQASDETPDWMKDLSQPMAGPDSTMSANETPDWLKDVGSAGPAAQPANAAEDQPDWLKPTGGESEKMESVPIDFTGKAKAEPSPVPQSSATTDKDLDDSFAWLESLAAKQGATEGLLMKPEERLEQEPDWVKEAKSLQSEAGRTESPAMPEKETPPFVESSLPTTGELEALGKTEQEQDDSFSWLENLAAKQGATEGLLTKPEDRLQNEPDWVRQAKEMGEEESPVSRRGAASNIDTAAWLRSLDQEETTAVEPAEESAGDDTNMWLKGLEETGEKSEPVSESADETAMWLKNLDEAEAQPVTGEESTDLPDWMQNIEGEASKEEAGVDAMEPELPPEESKPEEETLPRMDTGGLPSWLRGLDQDETTSASQEDLPGWLREDTGEPVAEPARIEPTRSEEWRPAEEAEPPVGVEPEPVTEVEMEKVVQTPEPESKSRPERSEGKKSAPRKAEPKPAGAEVRVKSTGRRVGGTQTPEDDPVLGMARNELSRSNIPGALDAYSKLIKRGRFLDEVIFDLREAMYRYPVEVSIWQSLGDAYMRSNRLQDALDAYTKAEELLR